MKTLQFSSDAVPVLGQGTWGMGEDARRKQAEVASLRLGLDLGMRLIDTAEMYGEGGAEEVVGEVMAGRREEVFLVSKVYPHNATRRGAIAACERSLKRLGTDRLDLYLLHWRGNVPLAETLAAFDSLVSTGKIRHWGVSNFDPEDLQALRVLEGGQAVAANQVLYNLSRRGPEWDLLPRCREHEVMVIAYSPIEQGRILNEPTLKAVAMRQEATPAQVALAWLLEQEGVVSIPKATQLEHVRENRAAADLQLTAADRVELDRAFPAPRGPVPLQML
ncbi:MAG: aldo/keto reductase [Gemmatimonadaceae bacterium]|nr:aldo/keto reductase [Gloeobacterales cyanobacterium ES-bin-141]